MHIYIYIYACEFRLFKKNFKLINLKHNYFNDNINIICSE